MKLERWLLGIWYGDRNSGWWLAPFGWLMRVLTRLRRSLYLRGWLGSTAVSVPVIVIGNITAGGTGKTPLVIWLVRILQKNGLRVGVLTRGYRRGGRGSAVPLALTDDTGVEQAGDEPVLIARHTGAAVVVGPERVSGARLLESQGAQVIVCDDGLQHYRLKRNAEIAVIDGARGLGNGRFIPAGPLRESADRLQTVTAVVVNGLNGPQRWPGACAMAVTGEQAVSLSDGQTRLLKKLSGQRVYAVAGLGNPERFFALLESHDIRVLRRPFSDHAHYHADDLVFGEDLPILMTEKDAVKCASFATDQMWFVPVQAQFAPAVANTLCDLIAAATGLSLTSEQND